MSNRYSVRKARRVRWSQNAVAKRERLRLERAQCPADEQPCTAYVPAKPRHATVSVRCGKESLTFQVIRWDRKKFLVRGKVKAASWIGKVVAVALEGIL